MGSNELQIQFNNNATQEQELLQAQSDLYKHVFAYADSLVLRAAIELRIVDIIHSHGQPITLPQLSSKIESKSLDTGSLARVVRFLVRKKILLKIENKKPPLQENNKEEDQFQYGLTNTSKFLLHGSEYSLAPVFLTWTDPSIIKPWFEISGSIKEGEVPFVRAHGESCYERAARNEEFNRMFNSGMGAATKLVIDAVIKGYDYEFRKMEGCIVDVGGGIGMLVGKIVEVYYPKIKGINFDMPHVVENAPKYDGVTHVGGDLFEEIPMADNVIIKSVLLNWRDEECIKILKKCKKAVSNKKGKIIIVDIILHPDRHDMFDDVNMALDFLMMTNCIGGRERTQTEWKNLLTKAGFNHINIIPLQAMMSLIEVIP